MSKLGLILIAGPTASGKSALALSLARSQQADIINADALQVYRGWRILTARPSPSETALAPHRLYGHIDWHDPTYSVGRWLGEAAAALQELQQARKPAIIVGGTGLYFKALTEGLAPIPPTPPELRTEVARELEAAGLAAALAQLKEQDPETAARLDPHNPRRVARALEVLRLTGRGLAAWSRETPAPIAPLSKCIALRLTPDRAKLRARISERFHKMIGAGALQEVRSAMATGLAPESPAMKALGAPELSAHLRGEISLDHAISSAITATHAYAKRQATWSRNQMSAWRAVTDADAADLTAHPERLTAIGLN